MAKKSASKPPLTVETINHTDDKRINIPTAELQSVVHDEHLSPVQVAYRRRNADLDPQLVWRGKDMQDWSDLVVNAPPIYIQEKIHPKALVDDLRRQTQQHDPTPKYYMPNLFADFNGVPEGADKTDFYQHDQNWTNRMILGDSLQVMASLAEREGLRGKVQCIYFDPPYGIKFNSNFQWSTTSRDVKDGNRDHITREPEQVKAFRDTWRDGIHSYLTYLRDRLTVARDLLTDSGSIFVQIGDENVHRVRAVMDEVFGDENLVSTIIYRTTGNQKGGTLEPICDYILFYCKDSARMKYRQLYLEKADQSEELANPLTGGGTYATQIFEFEVQGRKFRPAYNNSWKTAIVGMTRLLKADRLMPKANSLRYKALLSDFGLTPQTNVWLDSMGQREKVYVVQTNEKIVQRCILMTTDPGDLVLDPTCGSGTTATVAEQWGRRWITIDTSRVALALARSRIMGRPYPFYLLADSREGQRKEAEVTASTPSSQPVFGNIHHGFVYERVPHITLKSIANNAEIDVIWEQWQATLVPLLAELSAVSGQKKTLEEWEVPRERPSDWPTATEPLLDAFWKARIARQKKIDASIAARAEFEYLYDKPYPDKTKVRVAGPFTVESLSPFRTMGVDENDDLIDPLAVRSLADAGKPSFDRMILENLQTAGVQQAHREDRINFTTLDPWPGVLVCAEGRYQEGDTEKRAAIFIGPEFGTVQRADLVAAAREAGDAGFDVLVACAFNFDALTSEFTKLGRVPVLKARMNADLHMSRDLKNTGKGNLFVIFGEPDISVLPQADGRLKLKINGVDIFKPQTGEVISSGADGIACWFIDTDYNEESFFVRHAYFLGANDPYGSLRTSLKAEINAEAWESLKSDTSRAFDKPASGRIAVKVINHLGDEVMKVFKL